MPWASKAVWHAYFIILLQNFRRCTRNSYTELGLTVFLGPWPTLQHNKAINFHACPSATSHVWMGKIQERFKRHFLLAQNATIRRDWFPMCFFRSVFHQERSGLSFANMSHSVRVSCSRQLFSRPIVPAQNEVAKILQVYLQISSKDVFGKSGDQNVEGRFQSTWVLNARDSCMYPKKLIDKTAKTKCGLQSKKRCKHVLLAKLSIPDP